MLKRVSMHSSRNVQQFGRTTSQPLFNIEEDVVAFANDTRYRLGARIFTLDPALSLCVAKAVCSGIV